MTARAFDELVAANRQAVIDRATELVVVAEHHGPGHHTDCAIQHLRLAIENLVWSEYKRLHSHRFASNPDAQQ